jgi:sialate O-acetylesterase
MIRRYWQLVGTIAFFLAAACARADVKLHPLFTDNMVLQRGGPIAIWGAADGGEQVSIRLERASPECEDVVSTAVTADEAGGWTATLPQPKSAGPYQITVEGMNKLTLKDVLIGEVWICSGQSNMEMKLSDTFEAESAIANSANPKMRLFTVNRKTAGEPQRTMDSTGWQECKPETVRSFSAVGYYFGRDVQKALDVPVGLIHTSWGGTPAQAWTSRGGLNAVPELRYYHTRLDRALQMYDPEKAKATYEEALKKWEADSQTAKDAGKSPPRRPQLANHPHKNPGSPSTLYNAMIAPLVPYAFRGVIWYQGEANAGAAYEYRTLFPTMINDWRKQWGAEFPFLFVQLAPWRKINPAPMDSDWAELREAQLMTTRKLPKTGMAVITDVGEEDDIHPRKKEPVGARLALLARAIAYGENVLAYGPTYKGVRVNGNQAILSFDHVGAGLECRGDKLTGFTVAGPDQKFHNATAEISGDTVVVFAPEVEKPVSVRFGWANFPVVNLWNKDGLPASPFRTDDWPGITIPKSGIGTATGVEK